MSVMSVPESLPVPEKPADPGALGLGAFALTTFVLSLANTGWVPAAGASVLAVALFYGGLAQFAAGMWEFARGNTFAATAFTSYGAFWLSFWWLETNPAVAQQAGPSGVGAYLLAWAIFTGYMTIAAVKTNRVTLVVFALLTVTFLALAIGAFTGLGGISQAGGWLGLATALAAWYGSAATVVNATWGRILVPVGAPRS
ncbi:MULTISPECIES: acetate uptake transporter [unclassified Cryobacterium]|uniref:acetate uptake transporter n=1 Tax=unclassified Cryobacterium TaxID=2649013 RepID=UPI002AB41F54|nr:MULTISPECIES: acetate uptake transporter [unclassified Cryobacterium]MDY7543088.1 acetate uptake transporter [Cryobacterium sp. 5B3]MEA9999911.1 acetate uptake transporter [Cryobacterium sp. RTS3]MEB0265659.1 acetate uptake transporter [Cryobacterium sp. 10I5]MEB0274461.1 acetate uptake transporter [Cryobacterium sp. 5B3]